MAKKAKKTETQTPATPPASAGDMAKAIFASIVAATKANSFIYTTEAQREGIPANYIVTSTMAVDPTNTLAIGTKATDEGVAWFDSQNSGDSAPQTTAPKTNRPAAKFVVITATPGLLPEPKRGFGGGAKREETYPFSQLEIGQYLVFPKTDAMPDPARALASTVSSASRRFSTETSQTKTRMVKGVQTTFPVREYQRKFEIRAVDNIGALGPQFSAYNGVGGAVVERTK
jgi:hypothetical protein